GRGGGGEGGPGREVGGEKPKTCPIRRGGKLKENPPYEMNGSVMPLAGMSARLTAILIADWAPNKMASPATENRENGSSLRMALPSARSTMNANRRTRTRHSTKPNSSAATANTKSASLTGKMGFTVPSPGPWPNQPPRKNDSTAASTWNVSPDAGSRKRLMRRATCGIVVYAATRPSTAAPPRPATQITRIPAMKNSAPHTSVTSMV